MRRSIALFALCALLVSTAGCALVANTSTVQTQQGGSGDYDRCESVGNYTDLLSDGEDIFTLPDGTPLDRWSVNCPYLDALDKPYRVYSYYALKSGEILLCEGAGLIPNEAPDIYGCDRFDRLSDDVRAAILDYYASVTEEYDLDAELAAAYDEFCRCVTADEWYDYREVGRSSVVTASSERLIFINSGRTNDIFDKSTGARLTADELFSVPWSDVAGYIAYQSRAYRDFDMSDALQKELGEKITPEMVEFRPAVYGARVDSGGMWVRFYWGELTNAEIPWGGTYAAQLPYYSSVAEVMYDWAMPNRMGA